MGASTPTDNVSLHRTGDPPAGFPGVRAMQRPWPRPTAGSKESGSDTGQKRHHNKYMFSASVLATKGPGRRRAYAHWTEGDPLPRRRRRPMPDTSATNYFRWTARKATGQARNVARTPGARARSLQPRAKVTQVLFLFWFWFWLLLLLLLLLLLSLSSFLLLLLLLLGLVSVAFGF